MITYIYHKDSTLHAANNKELIGALPVVNAEAISAFYNAWIITGIKAKHRESNIVETDEGIPVALPGWGLDNVDQYKKITPNMENEWFIGCLDESYSYTRRQAYRLVRSEPENKRKKSNTLVGDDLLKQFVNKQIKLTVYSQKLWHSDKPFPVKNNLSYFSPEDINKIHINDINHWLSTANEVVNPEVIPQIKIMVEGDRKCLHFNNGFHSLRELNDGDQIPLPDGYGIEKKEEPEFPGLDHTSYPTFKTVARITRPIEYTDAIKATLSDCPWIKSEEVKSCIRCEGTGETSPDNQCKRCEGTGIEEHQDLCEKLITLPEKPYNPSAIERQKKLNETVEPSESQEETDEMWMEVCVDAYAVEIIGVSKVIKKLKEKFTITRK